MDLKEEFKLKEFEIWHDERGIDLGGSGVFKSKQNRRVNFYYAFGKSYESRLTLHSLKGRYDISQPFTAASYGDAKVIHEYNTIISEENFVDCHYTALLRVMLNITKRNSNLDDEVIIQSRYLSMMKEWIE